MIRIFLDFKTLVLFSLQKFGIHDLVDSFLYLIAYQPSYVTEYLWGMDEYLVYFSRCVFVLYGYCSLNYFHHKYNTKLHNRVKEME